MKSMGFMQSLSGIVVFRCRIPTPEDGLSCRNLGHNPVLAERQRSTWSADTPPSVSTWEQLAPPRRHCSPDDDATLQWWRQSVPAEPALRRGDMGIGRWVGGLAIRV